MYLNAETRSLGWESVRLDQTIDNRKYDCQVTQNSFAGFSAAADTCYAETGRGSAERCEPSAALTKLFPSSHIGPGNLRHSVSTSSKALTNMSTSFSPIISGGRIFITSIAWPATCVRIRCLLSI